MECKRHENPSDLYGHNYDWSRKVKGKTVNIRLKRERSGNIEKWIQNMKRLENVFSEIESIPIRAA